MPRPGSLFVTGGASLHALLRALGTASLLATGELIPGVALSRIQGSRWHDLPVVSKSGGFGAPDLLIRLIESVMP
jgi:D-threonate/D-erythronate kinase